MCIWTQMSLVFKNNPRGQGYALSPDIKYQQTLSTKLDPYLNTHGIVLTWYTTDMASFGLLPRPPSQYPQPFITNSTIVAQILSNKKEATALESKLRILLQSMLRN